MGNYLWLTLYWTDGGREQLAEAYKEQFWYCGVMVRSLLCFIHETHEGM